MIGNISTSPELLALIEMSRAYVDAMTDDQRAEMYRRQRESWVRAFQPCEHGVYDFEQCGDCRAAV